MKFGEYLLKHRNPDWAENYLNYDYLKNLINGLETVKIDYNDDANIRGTSLSVPRPTNAAGMPQNEPTVTAEMFHTFVEQEMHKIDSFTTERIAAIRSVLDSVETQLAKGANDKLVKELKLLVDNSAKEFLKLEKFVNLNFTGFHKILKKHDKRLSSTPCKSFYIGRLHQQAWVRGDHSDLLVTMSRVYSALRGDEEAEQVESAKQVRILITIITDNYIMKIGSDSLFMTLTTSIIRVILLELLCRNVRQYRDSTLVQELSHLILSNSIQKKTCIIYYYHIHQKF
jgi:SPX domain protein involved in polyphosphate accumulation